MVHGWSLSFWSTGRFKAPGTEGQWDKDLAYDFKTSYLDLLAVLISTTGLSEGTKQPVKTVFGTSTDSLETILKCLSCNNEEISFSEAASLRSLPDIQKQEIYSIDLQKRRDLET